ncbi:MAG: hypothetical protein ABIQ40_18470 [Bacteroidia bacterium]
MSTITAVEGTIGAEMEFCNLPGLWLESSYTKNGWVFSGGTSEGEELSLKKVWEELIKGPSLPVEMDLKLHDIEIEIQIGKSNDDKKRDYTLKLNAAVTFDFNPSDSFESQLKVEKISFTYVNNQTDEKQTSIDFHISGEAHVNDEIIIPEFSLDYAYKYNHEAKESEWNIDGSLCILAFQRLMTFKANAASLKDEQQIGFSFESTNPVLHLAYFKHIKDTDAATILKDLSGDNVPEQGYLLLAKLAPDAFAKLGDHYTAEQKAAIGQVIEQAKKADHALVSIPDIFDTDKTICKVSPKQFKLNLTRKNKRFESFDFAIGSDLIIYNSCDNYSELLKMENGVVSTGYNKTKKEFYFKFTCDSLTLKPLHAITVVPGIMGALQLAFGETSTTHPKASAFINMLEIKPGNFTFIKQDTHWQLSGSVRMELTNGLKIVDESLYNFLERLFPKTGDVRFIEGGLNYDSKDGLTFVLENNNGIVVPDLLIGLVKTLDSDFKKSFRNSTLIDLDKASELGESFFILDRVRLKIAKEVSFDMRVGIGLPSRLNDRLFNPESKIYGLINTYDREKYLKANEKKESHEVEYDKPLPDDNIIRATLKFGTDGISGQLDKFNVFNLEKISEEFNGFFKEENDGVILDFKALTNDSAKEYAKLRLDKFTFKLDFKTCAFHVGGGMQLLSDKLSFPVKPLLKKIIGLLPPGEIANELDKLAEKFTDSITLKSLNFYDKATDTLSINELLDFLKQFLLAKHQHEEVIPQNVVDLLNKNLDKIAKVLPDMLLEYLSIKIPAGVKFNLEITADQSVSFALEVTEPTEEQKKQGYTDYLQWLVPTVTALNGFRLKKIGFGSGLFNQAIRLDLSGEMIVIDYLQTIPGIGLSVLRQANPDDQRLQFVAPDVKTFGYRYTLDNLLMFIFLQAAVPIPVPVFYDKFSIYAAGIEGSKNEVAIRFPRPKVNIKELFSGIGDLAKFFKTKEFALPISSYGLTRNKEEKLPDTLSPSFYAGPVYMELPGIIGYEKQQDGSRQKITLGFKDLRGATAKDLFALVANGAKFGIQSVADKKQYRIRVDETRSEYPVNYMVKFLPASQRIGSKNIMLFEVLEANFAWAYSTPGEFRETVFPLLKEEQKRSGISGKSDTWAADEILTIIPDSDKWNNEQDGVVLFLKGGIKISDEFIIEAVTATAIESENGLATGLSLRAKLANVFDLEIAGGLKVNPNSTDTIVELAGKSHLYILGRVSVMRGSFSLGIGAQSHFRFNGMLDLFPDELFGGQRSPVQLYSGVTRGYKSDITGIIDNKGINIGHFNTDGTISAAGIHLEIGEFYLGGTTRIISTASHQLWEIKLNFGSAVLSLTADFTKTETGTDLLFALAMNKPVGIEGFLVFSGTQSGTGASGRLLLFRDNSAGFPLLKEFYLDGAISFLGFSTQLKFSLNEREIDFVLGSSFSFGGLQSDFALNCLMASDYSYIKSKAAFSVGLSFSIPKASFWFWLFGWHEVVVFPGIEWNSAFTTTLEINVYNPNAVTDAVDYDKELADINSEILRITLEQNEKKQLLEEKINGYEKKKQQLKSELEKKNELENRVEELRQGLISLAILDDLFEARQRVGNDDNWRNHYEKARTAYFAMAQEYTGILDQLGFGDTEQKRNFSMRLDYLERIFDSIVVHSYNQYQYNKSMIDRVKAGVLVPEGDIILQFVLDAWNNKKAYLQKYNLSETQPAEDTQVLNMQASITNLYILELLFTARNSGGSDRKQSERALAEAREKLFGAIKTYTDFLIQQGWKNEEQKQLFRSRLAYLNRVKENVIVYGYRKNGYSQKYVEDAILRGNMPEYDVILPVLCEVEKIKTDMMARAGIESLYDLNDLPGQKLPDGFGYNQSMYDKNEAYNRLLTKEGLYDYLKNEILSNEVLLRKLNERKIWTETQRENNRNRQHGEFRFELFLTSQLVINGHTLNIPKITLLVAPRNLQDFISNIGAEVFSIVKNNLWSLVLDAFKAPRQNSRSLRQAGNEEVEVYDIIFYKETQSGGARRLTETNAETDKPPGYNPEFDLTKYVKAG